MGKRPLSYTILPGVPDNGYTDQIIDKTIDIVDENRTKADAAVAELLAAADIDLTDVEMPPMLSASIDFDLARELYDDMASMIPPEITLEEADITEPVDPITVPGISTPPTAPATPDLTPPELGTLVPTPPSMSMTPPTLNPMDTSLSEPDYTVPVLSSLSVLPPDEPTYAEVDDVANIEALLDLAVTQLTADMTDGTYGMDATQEALLWERAKERERLEYQAAIADVDNFAASGFSRPPGAVNKALERAQQQYYSKLATLNREQTIKRADQHFEARKNAFAMAIQLKTSIEDINKTLAQIYETRVKAFLGRVDAYRTEETLKMDSYKAELSGFESKVRAFLGQVEANKANELLKTEEFKTRLGYYETQSKVYLGQIEGYKTNETLKIENFKALTDMYEVQQKLYLGRIEAFKAENQMSIEIMKAQVDAYEARIKAYLGRTDVFKTEQMLKVEQYKSELAAFESKMKGLTEVFRLGQDAQAEQYKTQISAFQVNVENARNAISAAMKEADLHMEGCKSIADVYKAIVASALSAVQANANVSTSISSQSQYSATMTDADYYEYKETAE